MIEVVLLPFYSYTRKGVNFMPVTKRWNMFRFVILLLSFFILISFAQSKDSNARIVAVADIHGAFEGFTGILERAQLIDGNQHWTGKDAVFVQMGDVLDRGAKGRQAMDLLMQLEKEAPAQNGRVIALVGNHEMMNLIGDLRYVPKEEYRNYTDAQSEKRQNDAYRSYQQLRKDQAKASRQPEPAFTPAEEQQWKESHPPGFVEQRQAFAADGKYGRWLRKHQAAVQINNVLFVHGGISPTIANLSVDEINKRIAAEMRLFDATFQYLIRQKCILPFFTIEEILPAANQEAERLSKNPREEDLQNVKMLQALLALGSWLSMNENGPLWFRGFAQWTDAEGAANLPSLLKAYKVDHFVVGHTVEPKGQIVSRFQNGIFLTDTGMNAAVYESGRASALEITGNSFKAIYPTESVPFQ
jgi:calcineurin-like phosphoesterase family protein